MSDAKFRREWLKAQDGDSVGRKCDWWEDDVCSCSRGDVEVSNPSDDKHLCKEFVREACYYYKIEPLLKDLHLALKGLFEGKGG